MNAQKLFNLQPEQELFDGGNYCVKMHELRGKGLTPWSTHHFMDVRKVVSSAHPLWNNYLNTDFGIAGTKEKIYLAPHSARLRSVESDTILTNYGLALEVSDSDTMQIYNRRDLILNLDLSEEEARSSPVWLSFADNNQARLDQYVEKTFRFGRDKFHYETMMGIFVSAEEKPIERAVVLDSIGSGCLVGGNNLNVNARLVGEKKL